MLTFSLQDIFRAIREVEKLKTKIKQHRMLTDKAIELKTSQKL